MGLRLSHAIANHCPPSARYLRGRGLGEELVKLRPECTHCKRHSLVHCGVTPRPLANAVGNSIDVHSG